MGDRAKSVRVSFENGATPVDRTINAELTMADGTIGYAQMTTSQGVITATEIRPEEGGFHLEGIFVGRGQAWAEQFQIAR